MTASVPFDYISQLSVTLFNRIYYEFDYKTIITKIYIHFDGEIKKSSIKMKLQNIKYLLNTHNVPNTLMIAALKDVSEDNKYAFWAIAKKYNKPI